MKKIHDFTIPHEFAKERLDQILAKLLPEYSRNQLQNWLKLGKILVNGHVVKAKTKMKGQETIHVEAELTPQTEWQAQAIALSIVYEDEACLVINKPVGLVVHPGAGNRDHTLLNALLHHHPELNQLPRAGIIHRLDKNTSGLLVIAKNNKSLKIISKQLKERTLLREYQAIVYGELISGGCVNAPIARHPLQRQRMAVVATGKPAVTHYRVAEKYKHFTRLKIKLETGRTHQIRVHMAHIRHPIVGDDTYGLLRNRPMIPIIKQFKRQALHAFALGFFHPITNEWMRFEIDLPEDMMELINTLRNT